MNGLPKQVFVNISEIIAAMTTFLDSHMRMLFRKHNITIQEQILGTSENLNLPISEILVLNFKSQIAHNLVMQVVNVNNNLFSEFASYH